MANKPTMLPDERRLRRAAVRLARAEIAERWKGSLYGGGAESDATVAAVERETKAARMHFARVAAEICRGR